MYSLSLYKVYLSLLTYCGVQCRVVSLLLLLLPNKDAIVVVLLLLMVLSMFLIFLMLPFLLSSPPTACMQSSLRNSLHSFATLASRLMAVRRFLSDTLGAAMLARYGNKDSTSSGSRCSRTKQAFASALNAYVSVRFF